MALRFVLSVCCLICGLCSAQSNQDVPPLTLFGITMGAPFPAATYPHCTRGLPADTRPCLTKKLGEPGEPELVNIPYETARLSVTTSGHRADGNVTALTLFIVEAFCNESLERLTDKLGKPSVDETVQMQNGFGARWIGHRVQWESQDSQHSQVHFILHTSERTNCFLQATSKAFRDAPENKPTTKLQSF